MSVHFHTHWFLGRGIHVRCFNGRWGLRSQGTSVWLRCVLLVAMYCIGGEVVLGQERILLSNSRLTLGTEENLSASIRSGDLDGDGDIDLVVANGRHWPQQNYVFLNDGNGIFSVMRPLGDDRMNSYACELADLDGDGDLDIVTGNARSPCEVLLNDGKGHFAMASQLSEISSVRSVTLADLDLDGAIDILMTCRGRPNLIYKNIGYSEFSRVGTFGRDSDSALDVAILPSKAHDKPSLVIANRDGQRNALLVSKGDWSFDVEEIEQSASDSRAVVVADLDGDGIEDLAFGNTSAPNRIYRGTKTGSYEYLASFGDAAGATYGVAAADMDGDGDQDIVVSNVGSRNAVFFNEGDGKIFVEQQFGAPTTASYGLCVADFNGDGFPDVAVANSGSTNVLFLNRPRSPSPRSSQSASATSTVRPKVGGGDTSVERAVIAADSGDGSGWSAFRGAGSRGIADGERLSVSWDASNKGTGNSELLWRTRVPGLGHSSPVVVGDRLFLATAVSEAGDAPLQVGRSGAPAAADDNGKQSWMILCYDAKSGQELWRKTAKEGVPLATRHAKATHANGTVTITGERLVAFFGSEGLYCYDLDGELIWKRDLGVVNISKYGIGWGYASSPAVYDDYIVLVCDDPANPYLVSLDLATGEERWRVSRKEVSERSWGTPLVVDSGDAAGPQVVVNGWPAVVSYSLIDGRERWRIQGGGDNPVPTPFVANDHIFITSSHGGQSPIYVVKPNAQGDLTERLESTPNNSFLWYQPRGGCYMSTPVVYRNRLYLGNSNGILRCFDATNGQLHYEQRLGGDAGIIASLVAGDGKIYCASENGTVYVVAAKAEFELLAENPMGSPCFASPAISDGVLYFRTTDELIAVGE